MTNDDLDVRFSVRDRSGQTLYPDTRSYGEAVANARRAADMGTPTRVEQTRRGIGGRVQGMGTRWRSDVEGHGH